MRNHKVKIITRWSYFSVCAALTVIFFNCGEPYYFPASSWEIKGTPPGGSEAIACHKNAVFLVKQNRIVQFDGNAFTEDYVAPEAVQFYDVGFSGNEGWAVGYDAAAKKPFIVHNAGGGWRELVINEPDFYCITQVIPLGGGKCWLVTVLPQGLLLWDGARLISMAGGAPVNGACYDRSNDVLYMYRPKSQYERELLITGDGGKSWTFEKIPASLNGFSLSQIWSWAAADGALYFAASPSSAAGPGSSYFIVKRTGGAARGDYELIFRSPLGPNFRNVKDMAFNDLGDGVAVGDDTTVVISPGGSYVEETIDVQFKLVCADAAGGFWGLAGDPAGLFYRR